MFEVIPVFMDIWNRLKKAGESVKKGIIDVASGKGRHPYKIYQVGPIKVKVDYTRVLDARVYITGWSYNPLLGTLAVIQPKIATNCDHVPAFERTAWEKYNGWKAGYEIQRICYNGVWYLAKFPAQIVEDPTRVKRINFAGKTGDLVLDPSVDVTVNVGFTEIVYAILKFSVEALPGPVDIYVNGQLVYSGDGNPNKFIDITKFIRPGGMNTITFKRKGLGGMKVRGYVEIRGTGAATPQLVDVSGVDVPPPGYGGRGGNDYMPPDYRLRIGKEKEESPWDALSGLTDMLKMLPNIIMLIVVLMAIFMILRMVGGLSGIMSMMGGGRE